MSKPDAILAYSGQNCTPRRAVPAGEPRMFRLIGQTTVFREAGNYLAAGFIPAIVGRTVDDRLQTAARVADVVFLAPIVRSMPKSAR